jgi:predicted N-acetyltransferase YhbS
LSVDLIPAEGAILDEILSATFEIWNDGLDPSAYRQYYAAQRRTVWGRTHLHRWALVDGVEVLASAKLYRLHGVLDGRPVRIAGLGAVFTQPAHRRRGHARTIINRLLERETAEGADLALLFSEIDPEYYARLGFTAIPRSTLTLTVVESDRRGAPAILVRAGGDNDLSAIAEMGRTRSESYRLHPDRKPEAIQFAITSRRLRAGLGPPGAREVQFFVAEEGAAAVAYVVITAQPGAWTIEEAGDRDPGGARLGAILQVLIARDPHEMRPAIRGWLPADFCPPQVRVTERSPAPGVMMIRPLSARGTPDRPLAESDVLYWRGDQF